MRTKEIKEVILYNYDAYLNYIRVCNLPRSELTWFISLYRL